QAALARAYGVEAHEIGRGEVQRLWPLAHTEDVIGAVYSPDDGRVNPSDLCLALSKGARANGAVIHEQTPVTGFLTASGRIAGVRTARGDVRAERVVLCGGLWSRDLAAKAGVAAPLLACEHYYLLTHPIDGVGRHLPTLSDHDAHLYIRDDVGGLLVGCFEPHAKAIEPAALGEGFAFSLLDGDWDHFEPMMMNALHRIPALESAGVRTLLNGPESFTPDGSFLLGESTEMPGLFLGCGMNSVGVATAGGAGQALAQWVVAGAAAFDLGEADPARFHECENAITALKVRAPEVLGRHYEVSHPGRQWKTARNLRRTPLHDRHVAARAHFGQVYGFERPLYFRAGGEPVLRFGEPAWHRRVAAEVRAAHTDAAVFDQSPFGKIRVAGSGAEAFLDRVCANDMTRAPGRAVYTPMLNHRGGYASDLTALRLAPDEYRLYVGTGAVRRDLAWLRRHLREDEAVTLADVTESHAVLALMGPRAAEIAAALGGGALNALGRFRHAEAEVAGVQVRAARISYVGEPGWELTCPAAGAPVLWDAFAAEGAAPAGLLAQTAMRIEMRHLAMGHDLDGDVTPVEAGLEFAVKSRGGFIGAEAFARRRDEGPAKRMVSIVLNDERAWPLGDEPVYAAGRLAGQATSAAFGHRLQRHVALAYLDAEALTDAGGTHVELDIAGARFSGLASLRPAWPPAGLAPMPAEIADQETPGARR
ncbi:MAG TPA: FAD-dependent oxidoreductase, partial [Gammaproteobacteria bacterium]|nr:FAD-dependent oxidoreductase [Gammaproteobacteria bacterium]